MATKYSQIQQQCNDVLHALRSGAKSRDEMWEIRGVLRSIGTDLEWSVRDRLADNPQSSDGRRAKASLVAMQTSLRWLEDNRNGLMRFEMHRGLEHAHRHAFDLMTILTRTCTSTKQKKSGMWDGIERRAGHDRRASMERRSGYRSPIDRRAVGDRRGATDSAFTRREAAS